MVPEVNPVLRRGWTTGACAAAGSRAAFAAVLTGRFRDPVTIRLPRGGSATFPLALAELSGTGARTFFAKLAKLAAGISICIRREAGLMSPGLPGFLAKSALSPRLRRPPAPLPERPTSSALLATCGKDWPAPSTAVEVAIVDRQGNFLARVGA